MSHECLTPYFSSGTPRMSWNTLPHVPHQYFSMSGLFWKHFENVSRMSHECLTNVSRHTFPRGPPGCLGTLLRMYRINTLACLDCFGSILKMSHECLTNVSRMSHAILFLGDPPDVLEHSCACTASIL